MREHVHVMTPALLLWTKADLRPPLMRGWRDIVAAFMPLPPTHPPILVSIYMPVTPHERLLPPPHGRR